MAFVAGVGWEMGGNSRCTGVLVLAGPPRISHTEDSSGLVIHGDCFGTIWNPNLFRGRSVQRRVGLKEGPGCGGEGLEVGYIEQPVLEGGNQE